MLVRKIDFLRFPGIPWNLDVSLLALVYIAIGFYGKRIIRSLLYCHNYVYDIGGIILILVLSIFCYFNNGGSNTWYYFDMKSVKYNELILAVIIPCMFGFVICRIVYWICIKNAIYSGFAFLGRMTIPVMYLHVPLNQWMNEIGYGRLLYLLIGIGVPVVLTVLLSRFRTMRLLFALPKLQNK